MTASDLQPAITRWLAEPLPKDVAASLDRLARGPDVRQIAVMPDVHLADEVCTGVVVATSRLLYPHAVGSDIGCGMAALRFRCGADVLTDERSAARLLGGLYRAVPAIRQPRSAMRETLPDGLLDTPLGHPALESRKRRDGRVEFATLGRGNHFLEFQADEEGSLWLMIHSGSRAVGQAIHEHYVSQAVASDTGVVFLHDDSDIGRAYRSDADWACRYATASRRAIATAVAELVAGLFDTTADWDSFIHCHHNDVRREAHGGTEWWVHRKGAISAQKDEQGIIPGSMGTASFHVRGRGHETALCSSSHGAGRRLSRSEAFHKIGVWELERHMKGIWFDRRLASKLRDEAPAAYKDIHAVMRAQRELTCIVRSLRPLLVYKGT